MRQVSGAAQEGSLALLMPVTEAWKEVAQVASPRYSYISISGRQRGGNGFMRLFQEQQFLDSDLLLEITEGVSCHLVHLSHVPHAQKHADPRGVHVCAEARQTHARETWVLGQLCGWGNFM